VVADCTGEGERETKLFNKIFNGKNNENPLKQISTKYENNE